jgi:stage II sporulation SpoAA-like protein
MVPRMIEAMEGMPDGTLGFRVSGEIKRADYTDVLVPALRKAVEGGGRLRQLYLIEKLEEMDPRALWEDAKTGFDLEVHHHDAFERAAMVTDQEWIVRATRLFAWMAPGEFRIFPTAELEQARSWVAGQP